MNFRIAALCGTAAALACLNTATGHEIVGNRMFPATLAIDDPGVADELAFPTISMTKTGDTPSVRQLDVSAEYSKRITEDFAVSFAPTWSRISAPGGPAGNGAAGFQNIETHVVVSEFPARAILDAARAYSVDAITMTTSVRGASRVVIGKRVSKP